MTGHPGDDMTTGRSAWLYRAPILASAALICIINLYNIYNLVSANSPRNPWEATEVLEGWRSLEGMPVYELSAHGHSTHMYGALVPWVQGEIFRWVGPNNVSGRVLTLISALVTVTLLAVTMRGDRSAWYFAVAWALILGVNHRSLEYFAENRPDMTALMFAALAMLLIGYGLENRRALPVMVGSACLVIGFFFKQTAAPFAAVPLAASLLRWEKPTRSRIFWTLFPLGVMGGVILGLKFTSPEVYFYMIQVPGAYSLNWPKAARIPWELLLDSPLVLVLLGEWIVINGGSFRKDPRLLWVVAALAVTIPFAAMTSAKAGASANSILPAILPLMAFCALRLPCLLRYLERSTPGASLRLVQGTFVALLMLMTVFPHLSREHGLFTRKPRRDQEYWKAVSLVKGLPGKVICPEDPTIPAYAKHYAGRNVFAEYDAHVVNHDWPITPPESVLSEIRSADFVVDVRDYFQDIVDDRFLRDLGFESVGGFSIEPACYRIWRRKSVEAAWGTGSRLDLGRD
jgi:hypothetical protein